MCNFSFGNSTGITPQQTGYNGSFIDLLTQNAPNNTPRAMKFRTTLLSYGITIQNDSEILIGNNGVYNIQFSAQIDRTSGSGDAFIDIWLRKNGVNVPNSNSKLSIKGNSNQAHLVAAWNFVESCNAGTIYQIMWATTDTRVELVYEPENLIVPHPAIPSIILTVTQV